MIDCEHSPTIITGRRGSNDDSSVTVCRKCGEFKVSGNKDGVHFSESFSLYGSYELLAASQAHRLCVAPNAEAPVGKRIWRPLDFAQQRLYHVVRSWDMIQDGRQQNFKDNHIVAAESPSHAVALIEAMYQEYYDVHKETIPIHYAEGFPLNVLQPLEWTLNGIQLLNIEFDDGNFVPGEFRCPKCQMRLGQRFIDKDLNTGVNPDPEPPDCMNKCGKMVRITWRDAAHEAYLINQRIGKRVRDLEKAWPAEAAMPFEDEVTITTAIAPHEHDWHIDWERPTHDLEPVHHAVVCQCGATACQEEGYDGVHDLVEPEEGGVM